jgi:hypothetical protein
MTISDPLRDRDALDWRTASSSAGTNCVEIAPVNGMVAIRHSKKPDAEIIVYTAHEWSSFMDGAKKGEFDDLV